MAAGNAWGSHVQNLRAVEEIARGTTSYKTREDIDLENTADTERWRPSDPILETVPDAGILRIRFVNKAMSLKKLNDTLLRKRHLGLVLLGPAIGRKSEASLIIVIAARTLFVFDPKDERAMKFLKIKTRDDDLIFYLTNGLEEADCLYHNYGIDFSDKNGAKAKCCSGMNVHLMKMIRSYPTVLKELFSDLAVRRSARPVRIEKFEVLVEMWLDIFKQDIRYEKEKLAHLNTRPLTITAKNIIRKRCCLVLPLARQLQRVGLLEAQIMSRNIFDILMSCSKKDPPLRQLIIRGTKKKGKIRGKCAHVGYYNHLDVMYADFEDIDLDESSIDCDDVDEQTELVCE